MSPSPRSAALLCALLLVAVLAACSPSTEERATPARPTETSTPSVPWPTPDRPHTASSPDDAGGQSFLGPQAPTTEPAQEDDEDGPAALSGAPADGKPAPSRTHTKGRLPARGEGVLDGRRMVALYGTPGTPSLGALGEQPLGAAVDRVRGLARSYAKLTDDEVVPAFELIASVASTQAGKDGDFSTELPIPTLRRWVERAARAGVYVVLDLQPGRTDFLTQAKRYAPLLRYPHVGLALDPEWRLGRSQRHLEQIGSVHAREVNSTLDWLERLTEREKLPQKLVVLHQFRRTMIDRRADIDTDREHVSVLIHADGQGTQADKRGTWRSLHKGAPRGVRWGWKNFLDEDRPVLTPKQTYQVRPAPEFVSYQ